MAKKNRKFGGRVRSDLSGLIASDAISGETAEQVRQQLRKMSKHFGHLLREKLPLEKEPIHIWLDSIADAIRPMYRPQYEWRPVMEIDRFSSSVGGLPYVTDEHPWPEFGKPHMREPMNPLVQLNLGEISEQTGVDVGTGLLQVWRHSPGDDGYRDRQLRVIEAADVRRDAELKFYPKAYMDRIASEWNQKVTSQRVLDEFFDDEPDEVFDYIHDLAFKGLIWGQDVDRLRQLDPWWAGGEGVGFGPWQIIGWQPHGFTLPEADSSYGLYDQLAAAAVGEEDTSRLALYDELAVLEKMLELPVKTQIHVEDRKIGCQDNLFGLASYCSYEEPDPLTMVTTGWQSLFSVTGPLDDGGFVDIRTIFFRKQGGKHEYALTGEFSRRM